MCQCHSRCIVERQVIAGSFCHAGSRGGSRGGTIEASGLTSSMRAQQVRAGVDRAAAFYFQKGIAGTTTKRYEGAWRYAGLCHRIRCRQQSRRLIAYIAMLAGEGVQGAGCHSVVPPGRY